MKMSSVAFRRILAHAFLPALCATLTSASLAACASEDAPASDLGESQSALVPTDPVSKAVAESCTTTSVKGLSVQLIAEIQCLQPGSFSELKIANTTMEPAVFPYLQTPAANALAKVAAGRNVKLGINSATRALPQQFLLYNWYKQGRCGIGLAARPGNSNHESGLAVDVDDSAAWRSTFQANGFKWLGASDPVHYDYTGPGAIDMDGLSVYAFQRLWNRNHPDDLIAEDKDYGTETETRLAKAPVGGFAIGAICDAPQDAGTDAVVVTPTPVDAGPPPSEDAGRKVSAAAPEEDTGCSMHGKSPRTPNAALALLACVAVVATATRRRARS